MPKVRNSDILPGAISFTRVGNMVLTTTVVYLQAGNSAVTQYSLGMSTAWAPSDPLQIKESGNASTTGWAEEQDISLYNCAFTTVIPWFDGSSGVVVPTTAATTITTGDLIGIYGAGTWSASGSLIVAHNNGASAGSQNSALIVGGGDGAGTTASSTELFNGSTWSTSGDAGVLRASGAGAGSQNAAVAAAGVVSTPSANTELFNGSIWATSGSLNVARRYVEGAGSQNATVIVSGQNAAGNNISSTELFNGSTWSTSGDSSLSRYYASAIGSQNAGLITGGFQSAPVTKTELFNGSTWSTAGDLLVSRYNSACAGSQNSGLVMGGIRSAASMSSAELFNGSAWYTSGNLIVARYEAAGSGSQNTGLVTAGEDSGHLVSTELHNQTLYRKLTYNNFREAKNIGIATDIVGTSLNVKIVGYINNMAVTSGNASITEPAQWATAGSGGYYAVLSRFSPNINTTNNPTSIIVKASVEADDYLVGQVISQTEMLVFNSNVFAKDNIGNW